MKLANSAGVSLAAVDDLGAVLRNPHFRARGSLVDVPDGAGGTLTTAAPLQRAQDPGRIESTGGERGADNAAVFGAWLGFSAEELAAFQADGVI